MNALDRTKAAFPCVCGEDGRKTSIHANGCYSQCGRWNDIAAVVEAAERDALDRAWKECEDRRHYHEVNGRYSEAQTAEHCADAIKALKEPKP